MRDDLVNIDGRMYRESSAGYVLVEPQPEHPRAAAERRIVEQLSRAMLSKLAQRREHGEWSECEPWTLYERMSTERAELMVAISDYTTGRGTREDVISEAADCANYLAMLVDVLSGEGDS